MATPRKPKANPPDWEAIEIGFKTTHESCYTLAQKYGSSEPTIRRKAAKMGWVRCSSEEKRQAVADALAGVTPGLSPDALRHAKAMEASADILDMRTGIAINRNILTAMKTASDKLADQKNNPNPDPREAKVIAEATEKAITSLREIRGLNPEAPAPDPKEGDVDLSGLNVDELRDLHQILSKVEGANASTP